MADGCHLNRPIVEHVERSSLALAEDVDTFYGKEAKPFAYAFLGVCRKLARSLPSANRPWSRERRTAR